MNKKVVYPILGFFIGFALWAVTLGMEPASGGTQELT
jgi:hypothetical protein